MEVGVIGYQQDQFLILSNCVSLNSDACYHVGSQNVTAAQAEVNCGLMGGRLASFVTPAEIASLNAAIHSTNTATSMWIGNLKHRHNYTYLYTL